MIDWSLEDAFPGRRLEEISPVSRRGITLLARHKEKLKNNEEFVRFFGPIDMLRGLEYHFGRYMELRKAMRPQDEARRAYIEELVKLKTPPGESIPLEGKARELALASLSDPALHEAARHEAVAYINRLGQVYYFATSEFVTQRIGLQDTFIPRIVQLSIFRHKFSAHRSLDKPRSNDSAHLQMVHAMSLSGLGGHLFAVGEPGSTEPMIMSYQLNMGSLDSVVNLTIEKDHEVVSLEAYGVLERLLR